MKASKHEIHKVHWQELLREQSQSGLSIREWCRRNNMSHGKFYYWQRIIREESLIKAGTLAVTGQSQFVEVKSNESKANIAQSKSKNQGICAILRSNGNQVEILNGADPNTLSLILNLIGK